MRRLFPGYLEDVDPAEEYGRAERSAPGDAAGPWVLVNMIASLDGATSVDGLSGGLGGPADRRVFRAVRGVADVILVGAGTARAEDYGPPAAPEPSIAAARAERGQQPRPQLAIVSRGGHLDPTSRLFAGEAPIVFVTETAGADRVGALAQVAEVVTAGVDSVDLAAALGELRRRGARVVLCEGGPSLNGQLVAEGLVDELCLTIAPVLAAGESNRLATGPASALRRMRPALLLEADGYLFARYVRSGGDGPGAASEDADRG